MRMVIKILINIAIGLIHNLDFCPFKLGRCLNLYIVFHSFMGGGGGFAI